MHPHPRPGRLLAWHRANAASWRLETMPGIGFITATAIVRQAGKGTTAVNAFADRLLAKKPTRLVTVALANKMARIAWAVMTHAQDDRRAPTAA